LKNNSFNETKKFARELFDSISQYVIGQNDSLQDLILNFITYLKNGTTVPVLLAGGTGTGKTFMCKKLSEELNISFTNLSMPEFTPEGYVGTNFLDFISLELELIKGPNIVFFDEFDKIRVIDHREIFKSELQYEFLKVLDREGIYKNSFFVLAGAFSFIEEFTKQNMIENGFIPELMGRIQLLPPLNFLNKAAYIRILKTSKDSSLTHFITEIKSLGLKVDFKDEAIELLAETAVEEELGARSLNQNLTSLENLVKRALIFDPDETVKN
jgi:ATP-dependent Clp protease ATP-binding subunit ClpX